jgi:hypothetical protein
LANGTQPPRGRSSQVPKQTAIAGFEESPQISPHLMARYKREDLYERVWTVPMRRAQKDSWLALCISLAGALSRGRHSARSVANST